MNNNLFARSKLLIPHYTFIIITCRIKYAIKYDIAYGNTVKDLPCFYLFDKNRACKPMLHL